MGNGEITSSISATGSDPSGLGQWAWFALSGRTRITTCIISAYCPSNSSLSQTNSVQAQHRSYLLSQDDPCEPRMAFLHDLGLAISTWQAVGDNIILMADMNCDIWKEEISSFVTNLGLQESILAAHPTLLPPITFKQGNQEGKSPIDGVWMSATLHTSAVSLCPFSLSPGDHRAALIDIDMTLLIGELYLSIVRPKAQCLNTQLPQTKEQYVSLLEDYFLSHRLLPHAANPSFDTSSVSPKLEKLEHLHVEGMHFAQKHCQKLYMGTLMYSPTLMLWFNQKILWSLVFKKLS